MKLRTADAHDVDALVDLRAEMFLTMGVANDNRWRQEARRWFSDRVGECRISDRPYVAARSTHGVRATTIPAVNGSPTDVAGGRRGS